MMVPVPVPLAVSAMVAVVAIVGMGSRRRGVFDHAGTLEISF